MYKNNELIVLNICILYIVSIKNVSLTRVTNLAWETGLIAV